MKESVDDIDLYEIVTMQLLQKYNTPILRSLKPKQNILFSIPLLSTNKTGRLPIWICQNLSVMIQFVNNWLLFMILRQVFIYLGKPVRLLFSQSDIVRNDHYIQILENIDKNKVSELRNWVVWILYFLHETRGNNT